MRAAGASAAFRAPCVGLPIAAPLRTVAASTLVPSNAAQLVPSVFTVRVSVVPRVFVAVVVIA